MTTNACMGLGLVLFLGIVGMAVGVWGLKLKREENETRRKSSAERRRRARQFAREEKKVLRSRPTEM